MQCLSQFFNASWWRPQGQCARCIAPRVPVGCVPVRARACMTCGVMADRISAPHS